MSDYFERRINEEIIKSKKMAWFGFYTSIFFCIVLTLTIYHLAPLKMTEVKVLVVDKNTGYASEISTIDNFETGKDVNLSASEALHRYFVQTYIYAHDSYNHYAVRDAWETVRMFSSEEVFIEYNNRIKSGEFQNSLGTEKNFETKILSMELLPTVTDFQGEEKGRIMLARVERIIKHYGEEVEKKTGTVRISYGFDHKLRMERRARDKNPLGFVVTSYQFTPDYIQQAQEEKQ